MVNQPAFRSSEGLLPQNIEAEQAVLGSLLIDPRAIERVAPFLRPEDFYLPNNAQIYRGMLALHERDMPTDIVTLSDRLEGQERLDDVGGPGYLASLATMVPTSINVEYYGRIVERLAVLRRLVAAGNRISAIGYDERLEADVALDEAEKVLFEISRMRVTRDFAPLAQILADVYEKLDHIHSHESQITGITTGYIELDRLTSGFQRSDLIILAARPSQGKCLTAGTLIEDPTTGERRTIEECVRRQISTVYGVSLAGTVRPTAVSAWVDSGVQPCFRVTTRLGRTVETTGHHPFLTATGWKPLHDLCPGSKIAVPRVVPAFGTDETWPRDLVRLLAYCIAEGGLTDTCPEFTNTDPEIVADFKGIIGRQFPECHIHQHGITYVIARPDWRGKGANPLTSWLRGLGLWGKLAANKCFPACVWKWSRPLLSEFLKVLMSCDGSIYSVKDSVCIEFSVASERLARDCQHALTRFGIVAKLWQKTPRAWRVIITEAESVQLYQREVGWLGEKRARFESHRYGQRSNVGHPPTEVWRRVYALAHGRGLSLIELARRSGEIPPDRRGKYAGYNPHSRRNLPKRRLMGYAEVLDDIELRRVASPDLHWDKIASIEAIGEQQVYDLTVPDGSNFIAQDVVVHNTALALNIAHAVAVKAGLPVGIFSVEMSAEQLAQRLVSVQGQIESQKLRSGRMSDADWDRLVQAVGVLSEAPIFVDDTPALSATEMRSKARRLHTEQGLGLLIVDYLQLMQGASSENRVQEISAISRALKALARELDVPVLALSQLSRAPEQRPSHEPVLSDLRDSGCLTGETLVYLPDEGVHRRIDSLVGKSGFNVLAINTESWRLEPCRVVRAFATGRKRVYALELRIGRRVHATGNHRFLTLEGWKRLDQLKPGDRIALPRSLPGPERASMSDSELALLGHLIGDGCTLPRHCVQYTTGDEELAETVIDLALQVFGDALAPRISRERDIRRGRAWYQVYLVPSFHLTHRVRNPVAEWLSSLGVFGRRAFEKQIPEVVFAQTPAGIARFLRHLWSTDGCIHLNLNGRHAAAVYYATSSPRLAEGVQLLLLRIGINARLACRRQPGKGRDQYHVTVSGKPDIERFLARVGALGQAKEMHGLAIVRRLADRQANTNRDVIPREVWKKLAIPAMQAAGVTTRRMQAALGTAYCGTSLYKQNLGRERAARLAQAVASRDLAALAHSDVYWDEISEIEPAGEADVYDLTVEGHHNFVANGITVHNSIEQDADIVMFIYRDVMYNSETERPHVADVLVAKHRNGPTGKISLFFQESLMKFFDLRARQDE